THCISSAASDVYKRQIMYHSILKDKKLQNDYTISPTLFEKDLKYLNDNGYSTVIVEDLINYVYHGKDLPDKCIMLTFDDGYYNNYYYAYPLLKKYKCRAVISPIASMTEKFTQTQDISVTYGHISDDNIREMVNSGYVEIQNHSYDMHTLTPRKGVSKKRGESAEDYKNAITSDITKAQNYLENVTCKKPSCFVYPFGAKSDGTEEIVRELGFVCTMTCTEEPNVITRDKESLFELGRYRRDGKESMERLMKSIRNA
ncbi:polysaccharide deacetylase family protein, partial [uncultured Ruminococcus sp.]|uniref:polysaccharide deacetylase family protein n=1 Tax=uncultured Ruminococcus sp. TaxID=165186 RepID=UPI0025DD2657